MRRFSLRVMRATASACVLCALCLLMAACGQVGFQSASGGGASEASVGAGAVSSGASGSDAGRTVDENSPAALVSLATDVASPEPSKSVSSEDALAAARAALDLSEDYRASFDHGPKSSEYQKYIVLHDTEGEGSAAGIVEYWDGAGTGVAAHFVVNKDGSIVQCVPLDRIAHHAGFGDTGHNEQFGVVEDGRDDMVGTVPIGDWASDYGMNAWSVGIELVHAGGAGDYPEEQLAALDALIAYIDAYFGFESAITDHKAWRSGNSDTSPEFAVYLANYQDRRTHL